MPVYSCVRQQYKMYPLCKAAVSTAEGGYKGDYHVWANRSGSLPSGGRVATGCEMNLAVFDDVKLVQLNTFICISLAVIFDIT